jgi:hypothetical protein
MSPEIQDGKYIFCTRVNDDLDYKHLNPLASFKEAKGLTLIISVEAAVKAKIAF